MSNWIKPNQTPPEYGEQGRTPKQTSEEEKISDVLYKLFIGFVFLCLVIYGVKHIVLHG